ncbi:MAG: DUF2807 domain-containing protein [Bacteroidales bacterium]|nr:DUF2807 domain-containing protein [Bacteroidales bacterium]MCF8345493.1 DUF2807 domain-containing protein [Bacteroidales bacterium]MCF8351174.1 DUF2807 domain-containing protein [Bacteroidales bacterium]MCF8377694.1 DUF2807 domain-containing protein [Bacteroidales bacterium]
MKTLKTILLITCAVLIPASITAQDEDPDVTRILSPFSKIKAFGPINLELIQSAEEKVEIFAKGVDASEVVTELSGSELKVRLKIGIWQHVDVKVKVYYKELDEVTASAGSSVYSDETLVMKRLELSANSGSEIKLDVKTTNLKISSGQGSKITLSGTTDMMDVEVNTGGSLKAFDCNANDVYVEINVGGLAEVMAIEKIDAVTNIGGTIKYKGDPQTKSANTSMGGSIYSVD